jgi:uncharacterized protein (DUF2236 family)
VRLTAEDRAEIREELTAYQRCVEEIRRRAPSEEEGIFGPDSAMWRTARDAVVPLVGFRAVLLQVAHPAVAAAGARNSRFREDFLRRAWRTWSSMYAIQFGALDEALESARRVHAMHCRTRGTMPEGVSPTQVGARYRANDPELLRWVLATMIDAGFFAHREILGRAMGPDEEAAWYADMRTLGLVMGLPEEQMPRTLAEFERYFDGMLHGDELEVGPVARDLADFLFTEGWSLGPLDEIWAAGLLPPRFREAYALPWSPRRQWAHRMMRRSVRAARRVLPPSFRYVPAFHQASMRVALARGEKPAFRARVINRLDRYRDLPFSLKPIREPEPGSIVERVWALAGFDP